MNNLSFICGTLFIGIISANANPVHSQDPSDNDPSLSCVLFKELGCDVQCTFMAKLQGSTSQTSASCNDEQKCTCTVESDELDESDEFLNALWNMKFDEDDVFMDVESIKQMVNEDEVNSVMRNSSEFYSTNLNCLHWVRNFFVYLTAHKKSANIQSIYHQVDLTSNELLKEKLGFFLKKNDAPKIDTTIKYEQDNTVAQIVANMVVDGMIKDLGIPKCFPRSS